MRLPEQRGQLGVPAPAPLPPHAPEGVRAEGAAGACGGAASEAMAPRTKDHKRLQRPETTNGSEDQRPQTAPEATGDPHTAGRGCAVSRENSTRGQGAGGGRDPEAVASSAAVRPWWLRRRVRSVRAEGRGGCLVVGQARVGAEAEEELRDARLVRLRRHV